MLGFEGVSVHDGMCGVYTLVCVWCLHVGMCMVTEEISTKFLHPDQEAVVALLCGLLVASWHGHLGDLEGGSLGRLFALNKIILLLFI